MDYDLLHILGKIVEWDICVITRAEDHNLDNPYAIDFEDESLWYPTKNERERDFNMLVTLVPLLKGNIKIV